jgi:hypothetical protein
MAELPKIQIRGICPHCGDGVGFVDLVDSGPGSISYAESGNYYHILTCRCPLCKGAILIRQRLNTAIYPNDWVDDIMLWPQGTSRNAPQEVPAKIAKDYEEAYAILHRSKTGAALLARRCLQHIIHNAAKKHDQYLDKEIKAIKDSLPEKLAEMPDIVRLLGKIAAHPKEDLQTGEILAVEKDEAEFALTIIEYLFDHYYVRPAKEKKLIDQIRAKAAKAEKTPKKK